MDIKSPPKDRLTDGTIITLSRALGFQSANQRVISGNLANADTPGYKPKELRFDLELQRASGLEMRLKRTAPGHLSNSSNGSGELSQERTWEVDEKEPGQMDLDKEMTKMMQNNLLYETNVRLLSRKFQALKRAIESGRR